MIAAACGDDDDTAQRRRATASEGPRPTTEADGGEVAEGGDLVIGAEQEPDCVDWISSCAGASWGYWTMGVTTMPRAFDVVKDGDDWVYEPSILLDGEPELAEDPADRHLPDLRGRGLERRRADHLHGLQVHVGADRHRRGHLRHHRLRQHRVGRRLRSQGRRGDLLGALRRLEGPLRRWLRHLPVAPPRGRGPQRHHGQRLRLLRWSLDDRGRGPRAPRSCSCRTTNYWGEQSRSWTA